MRELQPAASAGTPKSEPIHQRLAAQLHAPEQRRAPSGARHGTREKHAGNPSGCGTRTRTAHVPASPLHRHNTHVRTFQRPVDVM